MALNKSIEGRGGATATYHRIATINITPERVSYDVVGYLTADERNGQGRTLTRHSYSKDITSEEYASGITPASLYVDVKATDEFNGATDV